jgi:hypothetical protein
MGRSTLERSLIKALKAALRLKRENIRALDRIAAAESELASVKADRDRLITDLIKAEI